MAKRSKTAIAAAVGAAVLAVVLVGLRRRGHDVGYATAAVDRGDILDVVGATGALQAVTTVQVGSQVSGNILWLGADFNSVVKKGQVIARLDPSIFQARLEQMRANLTAAVANVERAKAAADDARQKYERSKELSAQNLVASSDLETAKSNYDAAAAQVRGNQAAIDQARANLNQAQVDLDHTVIQAPIDGVVIARSIDIGQTVAASFQAPVLFTIANDMSQMQVNASIDEADIGRVHPDQDVTFRVDAYPDRSFAGRVSQVRLQPITTQNVVTYNTIISVDNKDLKLMPGMTATVSVIVDSRKDVLRVPAAALRFRPEGFEEQRQARRQAESAAGDGAQGQGGPRQPGQGRQGGPGGGRQGGPGGQGRGQGTGGQTGGPRPGLVFVPAEGGKPTATRIRLGITDGRYVEVLDGLTEGAVVVTGQDDTSRAASRTPQTQTTNPFTPGRPQPRTR
jgi:HlyD family secretion protein